MEPQHTRSFAYIAEWNDEFLALFPHRFDYIWAEHIAPDQAIAWKTESRHPLSDRLIRQSAYLYGVRFATQTNYCLLDIDKGSLYHPNRDPFAVSRITAALEPLGLVHHLACTSSYSGGLHLYFPFQQAQSSWQLAIATACLLENAGFKLQPGQLEVFPNPKPFSTDSSFSLFNAHRLPLQIGSYLLDRTYQPIWSDTSSFVNQWRLTQTHNDVDSKTLKQILKQAKRQHFGISGKAEKFLNDLNAEIELGWTGHGQTNRLLGRITMRSFIFYHILSGSEPLVGQTLVKEIVETARSLPGYQEWCRHQHEIEHRAKEWTRCIENSHYFHYGDPQGKLKAKADPELKAAIEQAPSWNQQQSAAARDRIRSAIADLLEKSTLPSKATARFRSLLSYSIGGASLYRHRDLWHPNHLSEADVSENNSQTPPSLFLGAGGDALPDKAFSDRTSQSQDLSAGNSSGDRCAANSDSDSSQADSYTQTPLFDVKTWQAVSQQADRDAQRQRQRLKRQASQVKQVTRMQQFLNSGDPILVAEAIVWAAINPGILNFARLSFFCAGAIGLTREGDS